MKLGIRLKLFFVSVGLILLTVTAFDLWMSRAITEYVTASIEQDLVVRANVVAREASRIPTRLDDIEEWDGRADDLGATLGTRVTIIRKDGVVVGDSEVELAKLGSVENHRDRPEVRDAIANGHGEIARLSPTLHVNLLYIAVPFERDGQIAGVARVARPLAQVDEAVARGRRALFVASAIAFLAAAAVAAAAAQRVTGTVRDLTGVAQRMAEGDLEVRTRATGSDELGALGAALDRLAANLSRTVRELREQRDLETRILEGMQEGVLVLDEENRIVLMNAALRAMLLLGTDAQGKHLLEAARLADLQALLDDARKKHENVTGEIEVSGIKPRRLLVHAATLKGEGGGLLAVFVDVTDVRRLESLRRDFVANVSHELRTPVAAVLSATETLTEGAYKSAEAAPKFLAIVERNATRLQALIEDLLELSRLDAREYRVKKEKVAVDAVTTIVLGLFRERAQKKNIELAAKVPSPTPQLVTDARALEQILGNLVENAIKYCPAGAKVTIEVEPKAEEVLFHVKDTGNGIEARHLPRLFERFYRVDAGRSREVGGTGLGLSIVKHLAEALGGEVSVTSEVGKGSTFTLALPV